MDYRKYIDAEKLRKERNAKPIKGVKLINQQDIANMLGYPLTWVIEGRKRGLLPKQTNPLRKGLLWLSTDIDKWIKSGDYFKIHQ